MKNGVAGCCGMNLSAEIAQAQETDTVEMVDGSGHARGKRPGMEINFYDQKKMPFFS